MLATSVKKLAGQSSEQWCCGWGDRAADHAVEQLAATRDLTATWLVVDMDAFFASVEELHNPSLVRPCSL